jgi:hypothetical protein
MTQLSLVFWRKIELIGAALTFDTQDRELVLNHRKLQGIRPFLRLISEDNVLVYCVLLWVAVSGLWLPKRVVFNSFPPDKLNNHCRQTCPVV